MKFKFAMLLGAALLWLAAPAFAATNDLTSALQKGLFEEEANHDLNAAIQAYQSVATQFDKDRKLAATAVFRLGECYRKQGNTNQANAQFERVLREFADQTPLVTLSRTYLVAAGPGQAVSGAATNQASTFADRLAQNQTAAEADEVKRIQTMIKDSPDLINARDDKGRTPLHGAAEKGQMVVAQFLLANGAEVNAKDTSGSTPLHLAARSGHKAMAELLLNHQADVTAIDQFGSTPLHIAAAKGFRSLLELLLAHQADINAKAKNGDTPLHVAALNNFKNIAEVLLSHGAQVNAANSSDLTPLHLAARQGDQPMAELLLAHKAEVNAAGKGGITPLHLAAADGRLNLATLLLAHGAAVNAKTTGWSGKASWTPLHMAITATANRKEMVGFLLKNQADPNAKIEGNVTDGFLSGDTPLLMATAKNYPDLVELLLDFKADPNLEDQRGHPPLLKVMLLPSPSLEDCQRMLTALLDHGADPDPKESNGMTPLMIAAGNGNQTLVALLLAHKADVNARDFNGQSPLHWVIISSMGHIQNPIPLVELLLQAGANVNARNGSGLTPLKALTTTLTGVPGTPSSALVAEMANLLRQHGALEQMPDFASLRLTRTGLNQAIEVFSKDTNALNQFSLLEVIGSYYENPQRYRKLPVGMPAPPSFIPANCGAFPFPDLSGLRIHRPLRAKPGEEKILPVVLVKGTNRIDCASDLPLEFGDVVEIPERVHGLAEVPVGLTGNQMLELKQCVQRKVTVTVPGNRTEVALTGLGDAYLAGVLKNQEVQKILRSSSDFTRVRVTRTEPGSAQPKVITQNMQLVWDNKEIPANTLWLRDGDVIEVPDKP